LPCALPHPRLKNLALGSPEWFAAQRSMIRSKPLVRRCYDLWCKLLLADADSVPAPWSTWPVLELGSGSSYIKEIRPDIITSDVAPGIADMVIDGRKLPFADNSLRAIFLTHVFHHIPNIEQFLRETSRVLVPGGVISIVDETHTPFARFFFSKIHPEPYDDRTPSWSFAEGDAMLDSNQALTWIVFDRDLERFEREFPDLIFEQRRYLPWFGYLMSGGVNLRTFFPAFLTPAVNAADNFLRRFDSVFAIHWHMTIRKAGAPALEPERSLRNEARYLHSCFFAHDAPAEVVDRYVAANMLYCAAPGKLTNTIVAQRLDAEAIELVLRSRGRCDILTKKLQILFYLVEVRSENYPAFFGPAGKDEPWFRATGGLLYGLLQTAAKYLKGAYLVRKHGLI
jgi:SAM-dependent methyltransferase